MRYEYLGCSLKSQILEFAIKMSTLSRTKSMYLNTNDGLTPQAMISEARVGLWKERKNSLSYKLGRTRTRGGFLPDEGEIFDIIMAIRTRPVINKNLINVSLEECAHKSCWKSESEI